MYGGFIHSDLLMQEEFSRFKEEFALIDRTDIFRSEIDRIGISVEDVLSNLYDEIDNFIDKELKVYIREFYEEAPNRYRPIYLTKFDLFYRLDSLRRSLSDYYSINFNDIYNLFSNFHKAAYRLFDDENIEEIAQNYTNLFEGVLNKVELFSEPGRSLSYKQVELIGSFSNLFDGYCWKPYACSISYETVVGPQVTQEIRRILNRKENSIEEARERFDDLLSLVSKLELLLDIDDVNRLKQTDEEIRAKRAFNRLFKIYNRYVR